MENARKTRVKKSDIGYGYDSVFPSQLRKLLDKPDMTQEKLADSLGVARQSVAQWKDGKTMPDIYYLKKIAEFFDVPYEYLLNGGDNEKKENIDVGQVTGFSDEAIEKLKRMNNDHEGTFLTAVLNYLISHDRFMNFLYVAKEYVVLKDDVAAVQSIYVDISKKDLYILHMQNALKEMLDNIAVSHGVNIAVGEDVALTLKLMQAGYEEGRVDEKQYKEEVDKLNVWYMEWKEGVNNDKNKR